MSSRIYTLLLSFLTFTCLSADTDTARLNDPAYLKLDLPLSKDYVDYSGNGVATTLTGTETYQNGPFGKDRFYFNGSTRVAFASIATNTVSWWSGTSNYVIVGSSFYINGKSTSAFTRILNHTNIGSGFTGNAYNARLYNVALSSSEISALYRLEQSVPKYSPTPISDPTCQLWLWNGQDLAQGRAITNYKVQTGNGWHRFNGAASDGSYLSTPDFIGTNDYTSIIWYRANSLGGGSSGRLFDNGPMFLLLGSATLIINSSNGGGALINSGNLGFTFPQWNCLTVTRSGALVTFYRNGVQVGTPNQNSGALTAASTAFFIGNLSAKSKTFDGSLGHVIIWSRVLSAAEIKDVYDSLKIYY